MDRIDQLDIDRHDSIFLLFNMPLAFMIIIII